MSDNNGLPFLSAILRGLQIVAAKWGLVDYSQSAQPMPMGTEQLVLKLRSAGNALSGRVQIRTLYSSRCKIPGWCKAWRTLQPQERERMQQILETLVNKYQVRLNVRHVRLLRVFALVGQGGLSISDANLIKIIFGQQ